MILGVWTREWQRAAVASRYPFWGREHVQPVPLCHWVTDPRRLARLRARVSTPFSQTVRMVFERQLALPAALRQTKLLGRVRA
jgi:hypothetical protein